jgi:hypothetical protein
MSLDCDISIWLKYDITTWGLHHLPGPDSDVGVWAF